MNKLDKYHYFEVMDRAHVLTDNFYEGIETHPAVQSNPELKEKAQEVSTLMYRFYCLANSFLDGVEAEYRAKEYKE